MRRRPLHVLSAATVTLALTLSACGSGGDSDTAERKQAEATVTNCDRAVTIDKPIERAVAINQPAVEMLLSLGLEDRIVGVGMNDEVLPELADAADKVTKFGKEFPSFETVLDEEPDFIYTTFNYTFTSEGIADRDKFEKLGVVTYQSPSECSGQDATQTDALTLDDMYAEIGDISTLFGVKDRGDTLVADLKKRAAEATVDLDAKDVTLAWWYAATKTPYIAGCCGAPGIMTRGVGATNAFEDSKQLWPEISWESLLDRDPTVLVLADLARGGDGDSAADKIKFLESDPVASKLTAVKNKRYIILEGTTMDPSIRNVGGIEDLADGLRELGVVQ